MDPLLLESFNKELSSLKKYISYLEDAHRMAIVGISSNEDELEAVATPITSEVNKIVEYNRRYATEKRIFEYKSVVISLYGLLEKYVELWIGAYIDSLSRLISDYRDLSEKIRQSHFDSSIKLIGMITSKDYAKYSHLTKEDILLRLSGCLANPTEYRLNREAFVIQSGNVKHRKIANLLKEIDIELDHKIVKFGPLRDYIINEKGFVNPDGAPSERVFSEIDDLVERRNIIAHGAQVDEILDYSMLNPYISMLDKYCNGLFEVISSSYFEKESVFSVKINKVHNIWKQKIIGFRLEAAKVAVGDYLIIERDKWFKKVRILEIKIGSCSIAEILTEDSIDVAIRIEENITNRNDFYLMRDSIIGEDRRLFLAGRQ